jgi:hypothetical protein
MPYDLLRNTIKTQCESQNLFDANKFCCFLAEMMTMRVSRGPSLNPAKRLADDAVQIVLGTSMLGKSCLMRNVAAVDWHSGRRLLFVSLVTRRARLRGVKITGDGGESVETGARSVKQRVVGDGL